MKNYARISLHQLELNVSLGASEAERSRPQTVMVDIDIHFPAPPRACETDELSDTYCYDSLSQKIAAHITPRSFCLLEHLAHEIYQLVRRSVTQSSSVQVKITKKPFLSSALTIAGASFSYGD